MRVNKSLFYKIEVMFFLFSPLFSAELQLKLKEIRKVFKKKTDEVHGL